MSALPLREQQIRQCARRAIDAIKWFGWAQGDEVGVEDVLVGPCCATTATDRAEAIDDLPEETSYFVDERLARILNLPLPEKDGWNIAVATWNDDPARTEADVVAALQRVADGEGTAL
mgnify:CR=1 FL=1